MDHAVSDAVNRAVGALRGQIVEHDDGRVVLREIMLERQNLPAVAKRALRQQANFGQAVDDDALGLEPLDRCKDPLHRLAQLEVGGVEEALMLIRIEHALRRHELENLDL